MNYKLVRAECMRCSWSAGINVVAIVLGIIFLSSSSKVLTFLPEWIVLGFRNFVWAPKYHILGFPSNKKIGEPPYPQHYDVFGQKGGYFEKLF